MARVSEYDAVRMTTDGLDLAISGLKHLALHQDDKAGAWLQVAQTLGITKESIFRLAGDGAVKGTRR